MLIKRLLRWVGRVPEVRCSCGCVYAGQEQLDLALSRGKRIRIRVSTAMILPAAGWGCGEERAAPRASRR
jgi:hypothetical protein